MKFVKASLLLFLPLVLTLGLYAQTGQGVVTGTVFDNTGAVVPGATVKLTNEGTGVSQTQVTEQSGEYRFGLVPPGTYTLTVTAPGFAEAVNRGLTVRPSQTVPLNITLQLATLATTVEVTGATPLVQTATSDLTSTVDRSAIESTPLLSRNVYDLAFAAPAVTQGMDLQPSSGGARQAGTGYMLNGAENNDNFSAGYANVTPSLESVSEFTILTNSMGAQYGRSAGAIVSASQKSGTNRFHGVVYEFNRNQNMNAGEFFQNRQGSPKPHYVRNQFGFEVDGPIIKDKTFFAFGIDWVTLKRASELNVQAPTASEVALMKQGAGPIALATMQKYPTLTPTGNCPNQERDAPTSIGHIGCINIRNPIDDPTTTYFGRIDHNFSEADRLSFTANIPRGTYNETYGGGHVSTTPIPYISTQNYHNLSLNWTHTFSPHLLNEFTVAHNRHYSVDTEGDGTIRDPELYIDADRYGGMAFGYGPYEGSLIAGFVQDRWQFQDNFNWTKGSHSFKFGFGWMWGTFYRNWDLGIPPWYEFGNTTGPTPQELGVVLPSGALSDPEGTVDLGDTNFQHDFPYFVEMSIDPRTGAIADAYRHYNTNDINWFINDDWKVSRRLTLNLGLRYERYGAPTEANGIIAQMANFDCLGGTTQGSAAYIKCLADARTTPVDSMWNTRNGDFGPRFGFAFDVFGNGRTAVRGGFGISYDRIFDNVWSNGAWNPPFYALLDSDLTGGDTIFYTSPPKADPNYEPNSIPRPGYRVSVRTMEKDLKDSSVQNYYLGVEHQFLHDYLLRVNYQGSIGRHLPVLMNWNRYDGMRYNATFADKRPNALYTGFNYRSNNIDSNYNALVTEVQKRLSGGLRFQGGYTWSKLMDYGSELFSGETTQGSYSQPYYFVSNDHKELEKGPGGFDHTHNFKINISYMLPVMREQKGAIGKILGGWELSAFYQYYSGHPVEVYDARTRYRGNALDANGIPENLGGDFNLDGNQKDRPVFVGSDPKSVMAKNQSPADGIFTDNNMIGCGFPGAKSTNLAACNAYFGVETANTLFAAPPASSKGYRFGTLGRNVFRGPSFHGLDAALFKEVKITEGSKLQFRIEALNFPNHPNFDGITTDLGSADFGKAQILVGSAPSRRMQIGVRYSF